MSLISVNEASELMGMREHKLRLLMKKRLGPEFVMVGEGISSGARFSTKEVKNWVARFNNWLKEDKKKIKEEAEAAKAAVAAISAPIKKKRKRKPRPSKNT